MARWIRGKGLDDYIFRLTELDADTAHIIGRAIYPAARIVADAIAANIEKIPVSNSSRRGTPENPISTITSAQKQGLRDGFGISSMQKNNGMYDVKLGFDGYNTQISTSSKNAFKTKGWKLSNMHQANQMIARAVEGGTSFRRKTPFIAPAIRATQARAQQAMAETLDQEIKKIMK